MPYTQKIEEAAQNIFQMLSEIIDVNTFFLARSELGIQHILKAFNRDAVIIREGISLPLKESYCGIAVEQSKTVVIEDNESHPLTCGLQVTKEIGKCFFVGVPIILRDGQIIGTLCAMDRKPYRFKNSELLLLESMATLLSHLADLEIQAYHDVLTGCFNRNYLNRTESLWPHRPRSVATLFLDVDKFKEINDMFGHKRGDETLKHIVGRIQRHLREHELLVRYGGDEFIALLPDAEEADVLQRVSDIKSELDKPIVWGDITIYVSISIGVCFAEIGDQPLQIDHLIIRSDRAMYQVKQNGRNDFMVFSKSLEEEYQLEIDLRHAIENEEMVVYFQPLVTCKDRTIAAMEALVRWEHKEKGIISPLHFLDIAERNGLIYSMGEWVFRRTCRQALSWAAKGAKDICFFVNFSKKELTNIYFIHMLEKVLGETGVEPRLLGIEISEKIELRELEGLVPVIEKLQSLGLRISLDDFGSGVTTLGHMKHLPMDIVKIDMSLIRDIPSSEESMAIVKYLIRMAKELGKIVVAEGVEREEQALILAELGCDVIQGFFIQKPLPEHELHIDQWIR